MTQRDKHAFPVVMFISVLQTGQQEACCISCEPICRPLAFLLSSRIVIVCTRSTELVVGRITWSVYEAHEAIVRVEGKTRQRPKDLSHGQLDKKVVETVFFLVVINTILTARRLRLRSFLL